MSLLVFHKLLAIFCTVALGWCAGRLRWLGQPAGGTDPARMLGNAAFYIFVPALLFRTTARLDPATLPGATLVAFFVPVLAMLAGVYAVQRLRGGHRPAADPDAAEKVRELTRGGVACAFEMAGAARALELAYRITRRGGMTVSAGLSHPDQKFTLPHLGLVAEERTLKGSYLGSCVPSRDIPRYVEWYREGRLPVDRLLSERLRLEDINGGFDRLAAGASIRQVVEIP